MATLPMSEKYKVEYNKAKKEAAEAVSNYTRKKRDDDEDIIIPEPYADVILVNSMTYVESRLQYHDKKDWYGSVSAHRGYPQAIWGPGTAGFWHSEAAHGGRESMGAVVYAGNNKHMGELDCGWLVAWSVIPNKVYVETGPISKYAEGRIDWDEIKSKLENSTTESFYVNGETRAKAYAQINNRDNASVAVIFGVVD